MTAAQVAKRRRYLDLTAEEAARKYPHGSRGRYKLGKCRCARCKRANSDYQHEKAERRRKPYRLRHIPSTKEWRVCKSIPNSQKDGKVVLKTQSRARAYRLFEKLNADFQGDPRQLVSTDQVIEHLAWLQTQGVGVRRTACLAKVSYSVLRKIYDGENKRTRREYAAKILAIRPDAVSGAARVRSDDSIVLIGRMVAAGYLRGWIAQQLGSSRPRLQIAKGSWISVRQAKAIHALYVSLQRTDSGLRPIKETFRLGIVEGTHVRGGHPAPKSSRPIEYQHGTRARYVEGCRCQPCLNANRAFESAVRAAGHLRYIVNNYQLKGQWRIVDRSTSKTVLVGSDELAVKAMRDSLNSDDPFASPNVLVDAGPVRRHLTDLSDAGIGSRAIAEASGVSMEQIANLRSGRCRTTRRRTAAPLLAVSPDASTLQSPETKVDASSVWQMIDRLSAAGFHRDWLAPILGLPKASFETRTERMALGRARAVMALYASLRERLPIIAELEATAA